jgi:hypothetical protein
MIRRGSFARVLMSGILAIVLSHHPGNALAQTQEQEGMRLSLMGAVVTPGTDDFRYIFKQGIAGGATLSTPAGGNPNFRPVVSVFFSSFPKNEEGDTEGTFALAAAMGIRAGKFTPNARLYGEFCVTTNIFDGEYHRNNRAQSVGYLDDVKIGFSIGAGVGYGPVGVGYRLLHGGGGNVRYNMFFGEVSFGL